MFSILIFNFTQEIVNVFYLDQVTCSEHQFWSEQLFERLNNLNIHFNTDLNMWVRQVTVLSVTVRTTLSWILYSSRILSLLFPPTLLVRQTPLNPILKITNVTFLHRDSQKRQKDIMYQQQELTLEYEVPNRQTPQNPILKITHVTFLNRDSQKRQKDIMYQQQELTLEYEVPNRMTIGWLRFSMKKRVHT